MSAPTVGQVFTAVREIDRWRPIYYAAASGDFNPIHIDREIGEAAGFGGNILHGLCTMSLASEAAISFFGGDPTALRKLSVRFSRPVKPEDTITFRCTVKSVEGGAVVAELAATNQAGEEVLKHGLVELRLPGGAS